MQITSETCRICLGNHHLNEIFKEKRVEKIKLCASVQLSEDDELPKKICNQCLFYLDIAYVFRTVCETTDAKLRKYFAEEKRKQENICCVINDPVANEIIIGEEYVQEVDEIQLPSEQLLELCDNEVMNTELNIVPEKLNESNETNQDVNKVGRHTARKKLAKCSKRVPTVQDKSKHFQEAKVQVEILNIVRADDTFDKFIKNGERDINDMLKVQIEGLHTILENEGSIVDYGENMPPSKIQVELLSPVNEEDSTKLLNGETKMDDKQPKSYSCNQCEKAFQYKSHLERHSTVHSGIKEFTCSHCEKKFVNHYNLTVHMRKHTGNFRFKCELCHQGFSSPSVLKRHMNSHSKHATFQCKYCPQKLLHASSLKMHEKMHISRPSYFCDICFKVFSYRSSLAEHKKTHQSLKGNKCGICGKQFTRKTSLRRHMVIHTPKKIFQQKFRCSECHKRFKSKELLIKHLKRHLGLKIY